MPRCDGIARRRAQPTVFAGELLALPLSFGSGNVDGSALMKGKGKSVPPAGTGRSTLRTWTRDSQLAFFKWRRRYWLSMKNSALQTGCRDRRVRPLTLNDVSPAIARHSGLNALLPTRAAVAWQGEE